MRNDGVREEYSQHDSHLRARAVFSEARLIEGTLPSRF